MNKRLYSKLWNQSVNQALSGDIDEILPLFTKKIEKRIINIINKWAYKYADEMQEEVQELKSMVCEKCLKVELNGKDGKK